jgi:hypothetical protein
MLMCFGASQGLFGEENDEDFTPLFDGKTFEGWEGNMQMFRIEDGAIVAGNLKSAIPRNEFLATKKDYGDFELRLKAKLTGEGDNAGIQIRSRRIPDHHEMIGYQCDILHTTGYDHNCRRSGIMVFTPSPIPAGRDRTNTFPATSSKTKPCKPQTHPRHGNLVAGKHWFFIFSLARQPAEQRLYA